MIRETQWNLDLIGERTIEEAESDAAFLEEVVLQRGEATGAEDLMLVAEELGCVDDLYYQLDDATSALVCEHLDQLTAHGPAGAEILELTISAMLLTCPFDRDDPEALAARGVADIVAYPLGNMGLPVELEASGSDVWVTNYGMIPVVKIDSLAGEVVAQTEFGSASGLAVWTDGVWVTVPGGNELIYTDLDARTIRQVEVGAVPTAISYGAEAIWVINADDATLMRVDPNTYEVVASTALGDPRGDDVAMSGAIWDVVADPNAVWVRGSDVVYRIDPATNNHARDPMELGFVGRGLATTQTGIWVVDPTNGDAIKIDPESAEKHLVPVGLGACCVAADGEDVWVATSFGDVYLIKAGSDMATLAAEVQQPIQDITSSNGTVWVLCYTLDETEAFVARLEG